MRTTADLIRLPVADAKPVRRLRSPLARAALWIVLALALLSMVALSLGLRPDLAVKLRESAFVTEVVAALMTGIAAAVAAFHISLPDRSGRWALLPLPPLLVWLSTVGYGCLTSWVALGSDGLVAVMSLRCLAVIVLAGTPLAVVLLVLLRHARFVRPTATAVVGGLAIAALTVSALRLFHELDATVMVLIWNIGAGLVVATAVALAGRRVFARRVPS